MNNCVKITMFSWVMVTFWFLNVNGSASPNKYKPSDNTIIHVSRYESDFPIANNDTFNLITGCDNNFISGDVMYNDEIAEGKTTQVSFIYFSVKGKLKIYPNGKFTFTNTDNFGGIVSFRYRISEVNNPENFDEADVTIIVVNDNDCDGILDEFDVDDDNDGILDMDDGYTADVDADGIPNYFDIDSDNDGIVDNIEAQPENNYVAPTWSDSDGDGWDDAYDPDNGGTYFVLADTDKDGTPDFVDSDSDDDELNDLTEGNNITKSLIPEINLCCADSDNDGLDNSFDLADGWNDSKNPLKSSAALSDFNGNGIRNWRENDSNGPAPGNETSAETLPSFFKLIQHPAYNNITIQLPNFNNVVQFKMIVTQLDGKIVYEEEMHQPEKVLNTSDLKQGTYLIQIQSSGNSSTDKFIITK